MAINYQQIENSVKASIKKYNKEARGCKSIDEALEKQAEGIAEAISDALKTFQDQAVVAGGTCPPNGALAGAKIT